MALLENILNQITPKSALEEKLKELATYDYKSEPIKVGSYSTDRLICGLESVENILIYPNTKIIKELNTSFIDLMSIDYGYRSKRLVPIVIIRNLIDIATFLYAYTIYEDKKVYLNRYKKGRAINQFEINGESLSYGKLIGWLDKKYNGLSKLYKYCCSYVHSGYDSNKASSIWDYTIDTGYIGFCGKEYKLKEEDFTDWLIEGMIDRTIFDYEEECDIVAACIWVNQILTTLINEIRKLDGVNNEEQCDTISLWSQMIMIGQQQMVLMVLLVLLKRKLIKAINLYDIARDGIIEVIGVWGKNVWVKAR